jgi:hypothetical protein
MGVKPWSADVKNHRLYASLNAAALRGHRIPLTQNQQMNTAIIALLSQCNYLNVSMTDARHGQLELALKDKNQNLLEMLVGVLEKL